MALEEPTVSEMLRALSTKVDGVADDVRELKEAQQLYVTQRVYDVEQKSVLERIAALESKGRQWWTVFALPAMVGLFVWLIQETVK